MNALSCPKCGASVQPPMQGTNIQCPYCRNYFEMPQQQQQPQYQQQQQPPYQQQQQQHDSDSAPRVIVVHHSGGGYGYFSMYWMIRFGIAAVFILVSAGGWAWHRITGTGGGGGSLAAAMDGDDDWNGKQPLICDSNDQVNVSGIKATFSAGSAIIASDNCQVTCKDCTLKAPVAIQASGNANVILLNGSAEGSEASISASENAHVDVRGNATITGPTKQTMNAKIVGVTPAAAPSAPAAHPVAAAAAAAPAKPAAPVTPTPPPAKPAGKKK